MFVVNASVIRPLEVPESQRCHSRQHNHCVKAGHDKTYIHEYIK